VLAAGAGLQRVPEREADRLLQLRVALDLDVGAVPVVVEVRALLGQQALEAGVRGGRQRRRDLVAQRRSRARRRPTVGDRLDDPQRLARGKV